MPSRKTHASRKNPASRQVRPWVQSRSAATVERIVKATSGLLKERDFDSIAVDDIVKLARTSKGSFYFRFETKAHLLRHMAEVFFTRWSRGSSAFFANCNSRQLSLAGVLDAFVEYAADFHLRNRNLIRAFLNQARPGGDEVVSALVRSGAGQTVQTLIATLLGKRSEIRHPHPEQAVVMVAFAIGTLLRQAFLFPELRPAAAPISPEVLKLEIKRMAVSYLRARD